MNDPLTFIHLNVDDLTPSLEHALEKCASKLILSEYYFGDKRYDGWSGLAKITVAGWGEINVNGLRFNKRLILCGYGGLEITSIRHDDKFIEIVSFDLYNMEEMLSLSKILNVDLVKIVCDEAQITKEMLEKSEKLHIFLMRFLRVYASSAEDAELLKAMTTMIAG